MVSTYFLFVCFALALVALAVRYIAGNKLLPLTTFAIVMTFVIGLDYSMPMHSYQADCVACIQHYENMQAFNWHALVVMGSIALGSLTGWVALKVKHRKEFLKFAPKV